MVNWSIDGHLKAGRKTCRRKTGKNNHSSELSPHGEMMKIRGCGSCPKLTMAVRIVRGGVSQSHSRRGLSTSWNSREMPRLRRSIGTVSGCESTTFVFSGWNVGPLTRRARKITHLASSVHSIQKRGLLTKAYVEGPEFVSLSPSLLLFVPRSLSIFIFHMLL